MGWCRLHPMCLHFVWDGLPWQMVCLSKLVVCRLTINAVYSAVVNGTVLHIASNLPRSTFLCHWWTIPNYTSRLLYGIPYLFHFCRLPPNRIVTAFRKYIAENVRALNKGVKFITYSIQLTLILCFQPLCLISVFQVSMASLYTSKSKNELIQSNAFIPPQTRPWLGPAVYWFTPSHYFNQWWIFVHCIPGNRFQRNLNHAITVLFLKRQIIIFFNGGPFCLDFCVINSPAR